MKICRMDCPYCGANIEADVENRKIVYCTYCGKRIQIENDSSNITINQNININQNVNQRVINDAEILKEQNRHRENRWKLLITCMLLLIVFGISAFFIRNKSNSNTYIETNTNNKEETIAKTEKKEAPIELPTDNKTESKIQSTNSEAISYKNSTTSRNEDKQQIEILESVYSAETSDDRVRIYYAVKIRNPNIDYDIDLPQIRITVRSADGSILTTREEILGYIVANETIIFADFFSYEGKLPDSVEFSEGSDGYLNLHDESKITSQKQLTISNVSINNTKYERIFTGEVTNNSSVDSEVMVVVVYMKQNKMVGGVSRYVDQVKSGSTLPFEVSDYSSIEYDSYEIYAFTW